jgi:hypothetical protein
VKKFAYTVFDKKVKTYGTPFFASADAIALRSFHRFAIDPSSDASVFPSDFDLYRIGVFDEDTGIIKDNAPELIASATQFTGETK